jgi:predicted dehydrogenase
MEEKLKVLVVGCGNMGSSHARAYHTLDGFEVVALVDTDAEKRGKLAEELGGVAQFDSLEEGLAATKPDCSAICTYPDTHAKFARQCLDAGTHLFVEKPVAPTVEEAREIVQMVREKGKKLVVGYILRVHPAWVKFTEMARTLGKPLVMRMNLNQQSVGYMWDVHKNLMKAMSPIVDCGVHYVDVMCQMTRSKPIRVQGIGARLSDEIAPDMYNYGQLQVQFEDGSVGWYEAGWGPMMSEEAFFVKDVVGPKGCISIVKSRSGDDTDSSDIDSHTKTNCIRVHMAEQDAENQFVKEDEWIDTADEPDHQELCNREQAFLLDAIRNDADLNEHWEDAINSLRIVLAADESARTGKAIDL